VKHEKGYEKLTHVESKPINYRVHQQDFAQKLFLRMLTMYSLVYFEISGVCNGKCPWCQTARLKPRGSFVDPAEFGLALDRLLHLKLIGPATVINLFDWGEPFLHPDLNGVLRELSKRQISFGLSTNASRFISLDPAVVGNMRQLTFSLPGFSQASYDRIHGLSFDAVLETIDKQLHELSANHFRGTIVVNYHVYQFNIGELQLAARYFAKRKTCFRPNLAGLADLDLMMAYLTNGMDRDCLCAVSRDLLMYYLDGLLALKPAGYRCPQFDILTIDEDFNAVTCCAVSKHHKEYAIGSLFELSAEEIMVQKTSRSMCEACLASGAAFWVNSSYVPDFVKELTRSEFTLPPGLRRLVPSGLRAALRRAFPRKSSLYLDGDATFYVEKRQVKP